jgi:glycosyltransferase involved in cell wall biosynthesis
MKILWLCNIILPNIAHQLSKPVTNGGGWLVGLSNDLKEIIDIELIICFPVYDEEKIIKGKCGALNYYGFPKKITDPTKYEKDVEEHFRAILEEVKPDIVHIWGTEYPQSLAMVNCCKHSETVISIQGLCSAIQKHYMAYLPIEVQKHFTFRDLIKKDNLLNQQRKFLLRGNFEIEALKKARNVIGRTTWDNVCVKNINSNIKYYFCNETLREEFYKHKWDIEKCEEYSIFVSQGYYPLKGLHVILEAMPDIIRKYPTVHLYIGGTDLTKNSTLKDKLRITSYSRYILKLINKYNLREHITFTGSLDEIEMCNRFLKSNMFVCPSSVENSPNSLAEAMILGVPCVASYVGGIPDMLKHNEEGLLYQGDASYMLAHYICEVFGNKDLALKLSKNAEERARNTHNRQENLKTIINIYNKIISNDNNE